MYLGDHARSTPGRTAVTMWPSERSITFGELFERATRLGNLLRGSGVEPGDTVAIFSYNHLGYYEAAWAGLMSGLYVTPVNAHSPAEEAAYVIDNCDAKVLFVSDSTLEVAERIVEDTPKVRMRLSFDGSRHGYLSVDEATEGQPSEPTSEETLGTYMFYSSGTTGRPKGIKPKMPEAPASQGDLIDAMGRQFQLDESGVYLSPAPLHHAAPLRVSMAALGIGAHVVCMERFDAEQALAAIERYGVTVSQWVPTMFIRMLKLPEETRGRYDISSMRRAVHAAAPCPIWVKERMIEWWGPVISEYYSGSENIGATSIESHEWLEHKGSVGRPSTGEIHICDEAGNELPLGEDGLVYFHLPATEFEYHGDPDKTANVWHPTEPWRTLGDIGHLDEEGYLYLSDRATFMIIAGGANIYPREIEDVLVEHPDVVDAAVVGVPDDDLGEVPFAVVQAVPESGVDPAVLEEELRDLMREKLARYKLPRQVVFVDDLPRGEDGKLRKKSLREQYAQAGGRARQRRPLGP